MATDISPVFGLTLLEFLDAATIASICVAIGIFGSIVANVILSRKDRLQTKEHAERTHQAESARLALKMQEAWSETKYPKFAKFIDKLYASEPIDADDPNIRRFLGELETVAIFWDEKTMLESHVREFFLEDLKLVNRNDHLRNRVKTKHEEDSRTYEHLVKLLKKMEE